MINRSATCASQVRVVIRSSIYRRHSFNLTEIKKK